MMAIVVGGRNPQLVETLTGRVLATLEARDASVIFALRFSPDGSQLAALEWDHQLQLWDLRLIRQQLRTMNLDWDLPPYPTAQEGVSGPITLEVQSSPFREDVLTRGIPPRDPKASADLIDLASAYNALLTESWHAGGRLNDLSELPCGLQTFGGVQFDVRGLIQVGAIARNGESFPAEVTQIAIRRSCWRLHFLHAAIFAAAAADGTQIGAYLVHYANGSQVEVPIVMGESLADWFTQPEEKGKAFSIAWTGSNAESRRQGLTVRLFKSTWENPTPKEEISSIDLISIPTGQPPLRPAPFLVAITAE